MIVKKVLTLNFASSAPAIAKETNLVFGGGITEQNKQKNVNLLGESVKRDSINA